jgi:hypothetical protein
MQMILGLSYAEKVSFFFGDDPITDGNGKIWSTLKLIRNDIKTCKDVEKEKGHDYLLFPQAMCLMVAVDLLGKMQAGNDKPGGSSKRFQDIIKILLPMEKYGNNIDKEIYAFRNALHHSYKMATEWKPENKNAENWRFVLVNESTLQNCIYHDTDKTIINLYFLHESIDIGMTKFQHILEKESDQTQRQNFLSMFDKHGWMPIGSVTITDS